MHLFYHNFWFFCLRSSTCPLTGFFWLLSHVVYLKLTGVCIISVSSFSILQNINFWMIKFTVLQSNFLFALKLFLNAKSSLSLWSKWKIGHRKRFLNTNLFLIKRSLLPSLTVIPSLIVLTYTYLIPNIFSPHCFRKV